MYHSFVLYVSGTGKATNKTVGTFCPKEILLQQLEDLGLESHECAAVLQSALISLGKSAKLYIPPPTETTIVIDFQPKPHSLPNQIATTEATSTTKEITIEATKDITAKSLTPMIPMTVTTSKLAKKHFFLKMFSKWISTPLVGVQPPRNLISA